MRHCITLSVSLSVRITKDLLRTTMSRKILAGSNVQMFQSASLLIAVVLVVVSSSSHNSVAMTSNVIKLTYFDIEGVAEPIRLALLLGDVPHEDVRVKFPDWPALKATTPYGQLPVMEIGGKMKTQSGAMLRHVGGVSDKGLYPKAKLYEIEEAMGVIGDLNRAFEPCLYIGMKPENLGYAPDSQKTEEGKARTKAMREKFATEELPKYLGYITNMLEQSGTGWLTSSAEGPTIADCFAVPFIRRFSRGFIDYIPADCLEGYPKVVEYLEKFCALPEFKDRYSDGIGGNKAKTDA